MKIPKLFKKAAAFVMAAVTALSIMPATAFAAGDIGTIFFSHTYDSNGNAMRYNSSANIGGYTAGGTGNYKYRMFVDGENAFCIQPGVPLKTGNTLKKASSDTWNALSANQKKAVGLALLYGYQGNRNNLSGSDDEKWLATQTLVWEFVTGCREATGSYNQTSTTVYSLHFGSNYANSGARAVYDQIVAMLREHTPYVVEEVDTAVRYVVPASQTAPIEWNKVTKRSFDNVLKKFQVTVTKTDAETGSPQGDASLAGAVYGIYKGEELIDTYTTDENGQFTTKYYICDNDWTVREISPSEGYLLDTAIHKVGAEPELYTVELNSTANDVNEQVIKGNIALIKHTDNGETQIETPEEGAVFEVFLKSAGSYENANCPHYSQRGRSYHK